MIHRTSREHVLKILKQNQNNWKILDIGCNFSAVEYAQTVADIQDFSKFYREKNKKFKFVRTPKFEEVPYPVIMEPNLVIEYYSR